MDPKIVAKEFNANGYAIVRGVFAKEEVAEIKRQLTECIRTVVPQLKAGDVYYEDAPGKPIKSIFRLEQHSEFFKRLMNDERLLSLMREIYAGAEVVQAGTAFFGKAARSGRSRRRTKTTPSRISNRPRISSAQSRSMNRRPKTARSRCRRVRTSSGCFRIGLRA
jgi:hypothetical protein